ncbi:Leucine-rich repeat-containing protein 66 [Manis javanica]|nr:Leucine-rich repeat-containing protein 66 [Manis javanica]
MKNLCFRVITVVIGLYFTGTVTNPSRQTSILFNSQCQWNGYLLTICSFTGKYDPPVDISQTAARVDVSSSFFRVLLQCHTKKGEWNIKHLDLSNNLIPKVTLSTLEYLHALEILNLSNNAIHYISLDLLSPKSSWVRHHRIRLRNGFLFLKSLILQRKKLSDISKGLWKLKSLDLSFNGISQIGLSDFQNCLQLENLYLKSNKIFKIHPEAFKDLKKSQVVDLRNNVLTTILPMMIIALELPHLEANLADKQWQCDCSMAVFQDFISESWREKWHLICNKSIGNKEAYWWIPKSRISRETHHPHINRNHMKSLRTSKAQRPQERLFVCLSTPGKKKHAGFDTTEKQRRLRRWIRSSRDVQTTGGKEDTSQDFTLAVCLAVFITFFVAFGLGAFTRPHVDRLWQQRCRNRGPGSDSVYSNEGFYADVEAAGSPQHGRTGLPQAFQDLNSYENHDPFVVRQCSPHAAVVPDGTQRESRKKPGSPQSRELCQHNPGAGRKDQGLPNDSTAHSVLRGQTNTGNKTLISAGQDHIYRNDHLGEINDKTVVQEDSLSEQMDVPTVTGRLQTVSVSIHDNSHELNPPPSRQIAASFSKMRTHIKTQRTGESQGRECTEQLPSEFAKEMQVSAYINSQNTQQQKLKGASAKEELSACSTTVPLSDPGDMDRFPQVFPPGWGQGLHVTPDMQPVHIPVPSVTEYKLDSNYDSDEGSLFTLSSVSSEDARNEIEEEALGKGSCTASKPVEDKDLGLRKDNVTSLESLEDNITFLRILGKCENQEDHFEKPLIPGPEPGLCETHLQSASNTKKIEDLLSLPGSLDSSPFIDEIPGTVTHEHVTAPQSETAEWHCSLRDLEFSNVDILLQTPPDSAEVPSDPSKSVCHERDSDIYKYEPCIQAIDTAQNDTPFKITTGKNTTPPEQDSEGGNMNSNLLDTDANEGLVYPHEDCDSRKAISQTQLLQPCGHEPALQCERGGGECFEDGPKSLRPLLQDTLEDEDLGVRRDNVTSLESLEDNITFLKILGKCENQEDHFEKPPIPGPEPGLCETHLQSASNTKKIEDPLSLPGSLDSSPFSDEIPGTVTHEHVAAPQSETAEWHCSLRDLEFSNVDI